MTTNKKLTLLMLVIFGIGVGVGFSLQNYLQAKSKYFTYEVQLIDTCEKIAYFHNVTTEDIIKANAELKPEKCAVIYIGQKLQIPYPQKLPIEHTEIENFNCQLVDYRPFEKENIYSIALRFNITIELLKKYNNIEDNFLPDIFHIPICEMK